MGLPQGVTTTPSAPFTISPGSIQNVVFNAAADVPANVQQISYVASSGTLTHSTTVAVSIAQPVYAFVGIEAPINLPQLGGGLLEFAVDSNTGSMTSVVGPNAGAGGDPAYHFASATLPGGTFLFVHTANGPFSHLLIFKVDPPTGALTTASTIDFGDAGVGWIAVHPSGKFLYTNRADFLNHQFCIAAFLIDPQTANLNESSCSGESSASLVIPTPGNFAYATNAQDGSMKGYSVNQNDGSLTPLQNIPVGQVETVFASDPKGEALYDLVNLVNPGCTQFRIWTIDSTSGAVHPVRPSFGPNECAAQLSISFSPADTFAYVTTAPLPNVIAVGAVDSVTGNLTSLPGSPFPSSTSSAIVEPSQGKFLFGVVGGNAVGTYLIDPVTGVPTQTPASTVSIPSSLDMLPNGAVTFVVAIK